MQYFRKVKVQTAIFYRHTPSDWSKITIKINKRLFIRFLNRIFARKYKTSFTRYCPYQCIG